MKNLNKMGLVLIGLAFLLTFTFSAASAFEKVTTENRIEMKNIVVVAESHVTADAYHLRTLSSESLSIQDVQKQTVETFTYSYNPILGEPAVLKIKEKPFIQYVVPLNINSPDNIKIKQSINYVRQRHLYSCSTMRC